MTPVAILFLVLSTAIVWGGLIASALFLGRRPEIPEYPRGGDDESSGAQAPGQPQGRES